MMAAQKAGRREGRSRGRGGMMAAQKAGRREGCILLNGYRAIRDGPYPERGHSGWHIPHQPERDQSSPPPVRERRESSGCRNSR